MSEFMTVLIIIGAIVALTVAMNARRATVIYPPNVGLLYRSGKFERELPPGRYVFFDPLKRTLVAKVSKAPVPIPLAEFTVISRDQFSFRMAVSPIVEVVDARTFIESRGAVEAQGPNEFMQQFASHAALQSLAASAALEVVAGHTLREIFADSELVPNEMQAKLAGAVAGASVTRVLVTSITLPPETRRMFTDIERSKMEAESSLERARGEQASLRVLANAARLIKDNPALANLRFLQMLEQAPGAKTIVVGNGGLPPAA
jgi:regulator of protease activity HflC (stomatin/prohibitin superfamily)